MKRRAALYPTSSGRLVVHAASVLIAAIVAGSLGPPARGLPGTLTMDDGVPIAYDLVLPDGPPPGNGWPAVVLAGREVDQSLGQVFTSHGYAALLYVTRGHAGSGGAADFAGPRDVADFRAVRNWLGARPDISDTAVGAWGASYTGGLILNALAAGVPLAAADVLETWTDLYSAFWPQGVAKPLPVGGLMMESPVFAAFASDAARSRNLGVLRPLLADRSSLPRLGLVRTPVYLFQGRVDYLFDIAQAGAAFTRLVGPKKLYVGAFGHIPSPGPARSPDAAYILDQSLAWFDRFLRGISNGIESPAVELAPTGGSRAAASWSALPPTRTLTFGQSTRVATAFETWGGGTVDVRVRRLRAYPRLVAVVTAANTVVTHGAIKPHQGRNVIRLASYCVFVPKGARLRVTLGPYSKVDIAYPQIAGEAPGSISLGPASLKLSVLHRPVRGQG
jgi:X-Pro dipeptidyl-peptidase (S15 family)